MKLSTRSRYAVMSMIELAQQNCGSVPLSSIAQRQNLSLQYLEQLFSKLRKSGLVKSVRGTNGGYELAKSGNEISIYDIILSADEPVKVTRCNSIDKQGCHLNGKRCNSHQLWHELEDVMRSYLTQVSLSDVVNENNHNPVVVLNRKEAA